MTRSQQVFIGLDVGTQGARAAALTDNGELLASHAESFQRLTLPGLPDGWAEQDPWEWWRASCLCLRAIMRNLRDEIRAVCVTSTSGTIVTVDSCGRPLRPAIMYHDNRSVEEAQLANVAGAELTRSLGYKFNSAFGLPKILWLKRNEPRTFGSTARFIHAADWLVGMLSAGSYSVSDNSNALKTGYDLVEERWPDFIQHELGIPVDMLPCVQTPGVAAGEVSRPAAAETCLPSGTMVTLGATDGTASFVASGASQPGDANGTIGTTLVVRQVTEELIKDPLGRIYSHRHPDGWWLPGGASNAGGEFMKLLFGDVDPVEMDTLVSEMLPTSLIVWPCVRQGERLPMFSPKVEGFVLGNPSDRRELYAAYMEGVALAERWTFEILNEMGAGGLRQVFSAGGASGSDVWMQIRADTLGVPVVRAAYPSAAVGAAVIGASREYFHSLSEAAAKMVRLEQTYMPRSETKSILDDKLSCLQSECRRLGWIE